MPPGFATLAVRNRQPELMDQPGLDALLHEHALRSLSRINRLSRTSAALWKPIGRWLQECRPQGLVRILDVACGAGDVAIGLAGHARRAAVRVQVDGCDISPAAIAHASAAARCGGLDNVSFFRRDVLRDGVPDGYDVVTCSLFLHHLETGAAGRLLSSAAQAARQLVVVSDLRRTRLGYGMAWFGCRLLTRSPIVHVDGPLSVAAAFTVNEARQLAESGGMPEARISRQWPQRFLLVWRRPG